MNSNMVSPEKFDYLHLIYHFTVPLSICWKITFDKDHCHSLFSPHIDEKFQLKSLVSKVSLNSFMTEAVII